MADDVTGTATDDVQADQVETIPPDTTAATAGATDTTTAPKPPESFIDPSTLPEDIKPHWKRMHGAYTKKLEAFNARKPDHELLDKFRSDDGFALQLLRYEAERRGLTLAPVNGTTTKTAATPAPTRSTDGPPARVVEAIRARLDPSLQWMAESLAAGQWEAAQESTRPLLEKDQARETASRTAAYDQAATRLSESAPGWEAHEDDMNALLDFLQSPALTHPQFGDKLTLLYNAVTNGSAAKAAAIRDMAQAGRSASRTGLSGRPTIANTTDRVLKARTTHDAMKVAAEEAERELRAAGVSIPD